MSVIKRSPAYPFIDKTYRRVLEFSHLDQPDFLADRTGQSKQGVAQGVNIMAQDSIAVADSAELSQAFLEHPILVNGKPTKFSLKIPMPIKRTDWNRIKKYLDGMIDELIGSDENETQGS